MTGKRIITLLSIALLGTHSASTVRGDVHRDPADALDPIYTSQNDRLARIPDLEVIYAASGVPKFVSGKTGVIMKKATPAELANFLLDLGPAFLATGRETLRLEKARYVADADVNSFILTQTIRGLPVFASRLVVVAEASTGEVVNISGGFLPDRSLTSSPTISSKELNLAVDAILRLMLRDNGEVLVDFTLLDEPQLGFAMAGEVGKLAWHVSVEFSTSNGKLRQEALLVDAESGSLIEHFGEFQFALNRKIWDAQNTNLSKKVKIRFEGEAPVGTNADTLYNHMGQVHSYFLEHGHNGPLGSAEYRASINFAGFGDDTAGYAVLENIMLFSPPSFFPPIWTDRDMVAHESTHGVMRNYGNGATLVSWEPAALGEAISDMMAAAVNWRFANAGGTPSTSSWVFAESQPQGSCGGFRCLNNPRSKPGQVDYYPQRLVVSSSHQLSTVASHAFYLAVMGGFHSRAGTGAIPIFSVPRIHSVQSTSMERGRRIFLNAFLDLTILDDFHTACFKTASYAKMMYGTTAESSVREAWRAVGVNCYPNTVPPVSPDTVNVKSEHCYCYNSVIWEAVVNATKYELNCATNSSFTQNVETPYFGTALRRRLSVSGDTWFRVRACNNEGTCSPWKIATGIATCIAQCL